MRSARPGPHGTHLSLASSGTLPVPAPAALKLQREPQTKLVSPKARTPEPFGVGGFDWPAATCADPEKKRPRKRKAGETTKMRPSLRTNCLEAFFGALREHLLSKIASERLPEVGKSSRTTPGGVQK